MSIPDLLSYLAFPDLGPFQLQTREGVGVFDDLQKLLHCAQHEPEALLTPDPLPRDTAVTNETRPYISLQQPAAFAAGVFRFEADDPNSTLAFAQWLVENRPGCFTWVENTGAVGYMIAAVQPFERALVHNFDAARSRLITHIEAHYARAGFEPVWAFVDSIPLDGHTPLARPRHLSAGVRRALYRPIPERIADLMQRRPDGVVAKAFGSRGRLPRHDDKGNALPADEAAYDRRLVEALTQSKAQYTKDEILDTLSNRRASPLYGDERALDEFVEGVMEDVRQRATDRPRAPRRVVPQFNDDESLREHLYGLYYVFNDNTQSYVNRTDVEINHKAEVVFQYLCSKSASFYYFKGSNETVFVLDGHPYVVDTTTEDYADWFVQTVELFSADDPRGKELTRALRTKIRKHEQTHAADANWGRYDAKQAALYLCFDPKHTQMVRIRPAGDDAKPRIDEVANGTDGVTLRGMSHRERKVEYTSGAMESGGLQLFLDAIHNGQSLPVAPVNYRFMSTVFNLCCMLPLHAHRPLKFHYGAPGSGKTSAAFDFGTVLYGTPSTGGGEYDVKVNLLNDMSVGGPFTIQDNAESKDRWKFNQVYLVPASGKSTKIRKYYTEAGERVFLPNGSLTVTAVEPMHRPEELRRTFEFSFDKQHRSAQAARADFTSREEMLKTRADQMLSALLELFSTRVLPEFEARYRSAIQWLDTNHRDLYGSKEDYSDWFGRMLAIAEAVADLFDVEDARGSFVDWMRDLAEQDAQSTVTGDPILGTLESIRTEGAVKIREAQQRPRHFDDEPTSAVYVVEVRVALTHDPQGRKTYTLGPCTANQLFATAATVTRRRGIYLESKSPRALGRRLAALVTKGAFANLGWQFESLGRDKALNCETWLFSYTAPNQTAPNT